MWMPIFPLLAVLFLAAPSRSDDYDLIDKEDDQVVNDLSQIDTGIQLQMKHSKQCSRPGAGWKCKTGCYQSFLNTSGPLPNKCGSPISGDVCFGQELTYAHLETPSPFPLEYQILQNFPRCWAQLAPLICAVHYRPCVKQQVAFRAGDVGKTKVQTAIAELWSNLRAGYCYETVRVCQDVIKVGYFPSFINCSSSATQNSSIFTDSCSISSPPVPFKFSSNCPEPMVFFEGRLRGARPIMDQCYLKCRSDHFDRESRLYQNIYQATVGSGLTIVFLAAFFYLHFFSEAQRRSIVVFAASQSFLAISIWTTMWSLGSFLYHEVDCIEAGSHWIRRTEKPTDFLHWCVTQSMLINFAYSSAYLWLAAVAFFGLNCPSWLRKNEKTDFGWNVRSILLFGNYLTSGAVCIFLQLFHLHESDGVSGICLPGLQSTYSFWSLLAIPVLSTSFIALSIGLYYRKYKIFWNESIGDGKRIASELHKYETEKRRKFLERVMRVKNPTAEQLRDVEERLVQDAIDDDLFSVNTIPDGPDDIAADKLMGSENPAGYLHRLVNSTKSSRNVARIKSGLPETLGDDEMEEIVDDAALHSVSKFVDHYWRHRQQFYLSFGFHWLLTASVLAIFVIWTSIPLHYFLIRNDPLYEEQSVRDYVHCALNSSISQKQTEWIHSGRPNAAFSNCNLPSYLPSQRASYVLLVFILFPTAPFLILIASIAAGLCGRGGMKTIRDVVFYSHCSRSIQREKACSLEDGIELIERERVEKPIPEKPQPLEEEQEEDESDSEEEEIPRKIPPKPKPPIAVVPQGSLAETPTTAPSCPPSGVGAEEKISVQPSRDGIGAASSSADRPSTSREGSDSIASVTARLLAFIKNYGSDSQGMHPMPPFREFEMLVDDLQAAGRRERILSHQHHIAMEAMRDLSAFVNFNSERLRIDMEMWNMIMSTLNQLASVADGLFPLGPEGRHVAPEHARLYEILLGISQMLNTVNPHLQEFERWRDVNTQASHRLRESVAIIFDNAVASTEHQAVRPIVENAAPHATPAEEKLTPQQPPVQQNDLQGNANPGPSQSPPQDAAPPVAETFSELAILRAERKAALAANLPVPAPLQSRPVAQNRARAENQVHGVAPVENQQITPRSAPQQRHAEMIPRPASPTAFRQAQVAPQNIGSAYMESYSAAPNGFYTRFSDAELSIRISRMNEIHGPQGFPQEYMYALILTGDIRLAGNDLPDDGERTVMPSDYPSIFGRAVPLDVVTPPAEFLRYMRRRAIIFVMSLGYDFNHRGRDNHNAYMPPTFPALGMSSTNELILVRIFGTDNLIRMKSLLCELIMLPWLRYSPQIPEVGGFAAYLDHFATIRGFPHSREEWVHDPFHSPTPRQYSPPPEAAVVAEEVPEEEVVAEEEDPEEELFVVDELPMEDEEEFPSPSDSNQ